MSVKKYVLYTLLILCGMSKAFALPLPKKAKICLFVHSDFTRNAIVSSLKREDFANVIDDTVPFQELTPYFVAEEPDCVIVDASGLDASDMLRYESKVLALSKELNVQTVLLLSNFAVYAPNTPNPMRESALSSQNIEKLTDPYAISKFSAFRQCHTYNDPQKPRFIFCPYPYLFGPHDPENKTKTKHPLYHITDRILTAKKEGRSFTVIANDGSALYELLYINDFANAIVSILQSSAQFECINLTTGHDVSMKRLTGEVKHAAGYTGEVILDINCYDEVPKRVLDNSKIAELGFSSQIPLHKGIEACVK